MLLELAASAELFHTANSTAFADLMIDGHRETRPIRSIRFRSWRGRRYYQATGGAPSPAVLRSVLDALEARALFDAPRRAVYMRVAEQDGRLYLDLADEHWRAVEIGPDGWRVVASPPVRFRRAAGMLPLPVPVNGSIDALVPFLNLPGRNEFVLVVAWLLAALRHGGPFPCWRCPASRVRPSVPSKILRGLVDPNVAPVRTMPREACSSQPAMATCSLSTICPRAGQNLRGRWPAGCVASRPRCGLGIEIAFGREGRAGTRIIWMSASHQHEPHETVQHRQRRQSLHSRQRFRSSISANGWRAYDPANPSRATLMRNVGPRKSPVMSQARHGARIQARCRCDQVSLFRTLTRSACLVPRPYSPISFRAVLMTEWTESAAGMCAND